MTEFFIHALIASSASLGVYVACQDGMIFDFVWRLKTLQNETLRKPLFSCPICMASIWGSLFYWLFVPLGRTALENWIPFVLCVAGLNYVFTVIISLPDTLQELKQKPADWNPRATAPVNEWIEIKTTQGMRFIAKAAKHTAKKDGKTFFHACEGDIEGDFGEVVAWKELSE